MVTFAPNEKHSTLMIRLSRMRGSDPMATHCKETMEWKKPWGGLYEPKLVERDHADVNEEETIEVPMSHFVDNLFQKRQIGLEAEWPLYKNSAHLLLQPQ